MKLQNSKFTGGFSLLEIMVAVAIIAVMASSVVIGFGSFESAVRAQETAGVIQDTVKNMGLEMIRREYVKQTIHFQKSFLISEAQVAGQTLELSWNGQGGCPGGQAELQIENPDPGSPVYLAKRDQYGNNLELKMYTTASEKICVDFPDSEETEWQYQLFVGSERSQVIRFIHFNIRRGDKDTVHIESGSDEYKLELTAPYAGKQFYKNDTPFDDTITVTVQNGGDPQDLTLQE